MRLCGRWGDWGDGDGCGLDDDWDGEDDKEDEKNLGRDGRADDSCGCLRLQPSWWSSSSSDGVFPVRGSVVRGAADVGGDVKGVVVALVNVASLIFVNAAVCVDVSGVAIFVADGVVSAAVAAAPTAPTALPAPAAAMDPSRPLVAATKKRQPVKNNEAKQRMSYNTAGTPQ